MHVIIKQSQYQLVMNNKKLDNIRKTDIITTSIITNKT